MNNKKNSRRKLRDDRGSVTKKQNRKDPSPSVKVVAGIFKVNLKIFSYIINVVLTVVLIAIITGGIVAGAFAIYIKNYVDPSMPDLQVMSSSLDRTTFFYYRKYDDRFEKTNLRWVEWESERLYGIENRFWASYQDMPQDLINAFIAIEDRRFLEHNGVDYFRSGAAVLNFFFPSGDSFGGSTITQQLVKLMTGDNEQRMQRKIQEMLRAMYLENNASKEEILENYLNIVPLSNGCYGVQTAAYEFFDKSVSELTLIECAALAAIANSPYFYDPVRYPENNIKRRDATLQNMFEYGFITKEEFDAAYAQELVLTPPQAKSSDNIKSWYIEQVMDEVRDDLMAKYSYTKEQASNLLYSGGLQIYTCMDPSVQYAIEYVYQREEYFPAAQGQDSKYQSAMVIIDPENGDLLGIIGGRGEKKENRGWNRASHSLRSPGSSIKPVSIYAPALEMGLIDYGSPLDDSPPLVLSGKSWPTNLPVQWQGLVPTWHAIEISINTTAVRLLQEMTPVYVFEYLRDDLGFSGLIDEKVQPNGKVLTDIDISPLALGGMSYGVSVYQLTGAYTMFANKGIYSKPRSYLEVKDHEGNTILDNRGIDHQKIILSEENAAIMTKMLMTVVESGTGKLLRMKDDIQVAAKTGTTNDDKDRWFVGYTPYYVCGAWFGYDEPKYLGKFTRNPPMELFDYVMESLHRDIIDSPSKKEFEVPSTVITAQYCRDSGMAPGNYCNLDPRGSRIQTGYYVKGAEPREKCDVHVPVKWCLDTRSVAGTNCYNTTTIALVREEERAFSKEVWGIWDAQYTYRDVGDSYVYPKSTAVPFYANIIPNGTYVGRSGNTRPVNSFCVEHNTYMTYPVNQRPVPTEAPPPTTEAETTAENIETPPDETMIQPQTENGATVQPETKPPVTATESPPVTTEQTIQPEQETVPEVTVEQPTEPTVVQTEEIITSPPAADTIVPQDLEPTIAAD